MKHKIKYWLDKGDLHKAKKMCERYLNNYPFDKHVLEFLAYINFTQKKFEKASDIYQQLLSQEADNINYLSNMALCNDKLNNHSEAHKIYEKIIAFNTVNISILYNYSKSLYDINKINQSKAIIDRILISDPDNEPALMLLGRISMEEFDWHMALGCFAKIINKSPGNYLASLNFSQIMLNSYNTILKKDYPLIEKTLNYIYLNKKIGLSHLTKISEKILLNKLLEEDTNIVDDNNIKKLNNELTQNILRSDIVTNIEIEELFKKIRKYFLKKILNKEFKDLEINIPLLISISIQCKNNEYIWDYDSEEIKLLEIIEKKIENNTSLKEDYTKLYLYILCCYKSNLSNKIKLKIFALRHVFEDIFYKILIDNNEKEDANKNDIIKIGNIQNNMSKSIAKQYNDNPYPRWQTIPDIKQKELNKIINTSIFPNKILINERKDSLDVLIAGCGTGMVAVSAAKLYKNSNIYAFDLSLNSLAYAKRMADENKLENITFYQADILEIEKINKKFDVIECTGVLHHMSKPLDGLAALLSVLKSDGYLRISLYSTLARAFVTKIRKETNKKNDDLNSRELINLREKMKVKYKEFDFISSDFYSLSGFRDLFYNIEEHSFSQKEIKSILDQFDLEFLGYYFRNPETKKKFIKVFNNDQQCLNLNNWDIFEQDNTLSFSETPSFWCRKNKVE